MERKFHHLMKLLVLVILLGIILSPAAHGQQSFEDEVRKRVVVYEENGKLKASDQTLYGAGLTLRMLELNGFNPLWNEKNTRALFAAIDDLDKDGLNPKEYRFSEIDDLLKAKTAGSLSTSAQVDLDFLLSEAYLRAVYNFTLKCLGYEGQNLVSCQG